jgi:hypothetical protein
MSPYPKKRLWPSFKNFLRRAGFTDINGAVNWIIIFGAPSWFRCVCHSWGWLRISCGESQWSRWVFAFCQPRPWSGLPGGFSLPDCRLGTGILPCMCRAEESDIPRGEEGYIRDGWSCGLRGGTLHALRIIACAVQQALLVGFVWDAVSREFFGWSFCPYGVWQVWRWMPVVNQAGVRSYALPIFWDCQCGICCRRSLVSQRFALQMWWSKRDTFLTPRRCFCWRIERRRGRLWRKLMACWPSEHRGRSWSVYRICKWL